MPKLNNYKINTEVFFAKRKAVYLAEELQSVAGRKTELPNINTNISAMELANNIRKLLEWIIR